VTSYLEHSLGLPRRVIESHMDEKLACSCSRGAPKKLGVPFNIPAMAEASDFKIGMQLGFAKAHNKIPRRRKNGHGRCGDPKI